MCNYNSHNIVLFWGSFTWNFSLLRSEISAQNSQEKAQQCRLYTIQMLILETWFDTVCNVYPGNHHGKLLHDLLKSWVGGFGVSWSGEEEDKVCSEFIFSILIYYLSITIHSKFSVYRNIAEEDDIPPPRRASSS